jgi:hypothetical protein
MNKEQAERLAKALERLARELAKKKSHRNKHAPYAITTEGCTEEPYAIIDTKREIINFYSGEVFSFPVLTEWLKS